MSMSTANEATRAIAVAAYTTAAAAFKAHTRSLHERALERAEALEILFFEKPTHYFHARCDPRHFSDTTFTSVIDHTADGARTLNPIATTVHIVILVTSTPAALIRSTTPPSLRCAT